MQDVGCVHIHKVHGQGGLDSTWFLTLTLLFSISAVSEQGIAVFPFSISIFCFINCILLTLLNCMGVIRNMIKEMLMLCGKKYSSLIFNPVYPAFP